LGQLKGSQIDGNGQLKNFKAVIEIELKNGNRQLTVVELTVMEN